MHDNCKSQQNTKAKAWACSDSKGAVAVESAWIPEYVHVNMYCLDCFIFFWKAKAEEKSSIEVKCAQLHLQHASRLRLFYFRELFEYPRSLQLFSLGFDPLERILMNCICVFDFFYWGLWWYLVAHGLLWRGEVLICLTCAISVSWPMLKDFSTRVRGFFFRVVMADSAEDA